MKYLVFLMVLALTLCLTTSAMALYVENYEMDNDMTTAAGTANGNVMSLNGAVASGWSYAGGIGQFNDDNALNGGVNVGLSLTGAAGLAVVGAGGYTVDMRLQWVAGCAGGASAKTFGFSGNNGNGRGLRINESDVAYISSGVVTSGGLDLTGGQWQSIRIIVQADGSQDIYRSDNSWIMGIVAPGATGLPGASGGAPIIALGNYAGGSTTLTTINVDYVRIAQGTDLYADHNPVIPEPGSMLALASGLIGMAGFAIRRRRA
ncbi:MAG: PEP-CTERM sorting domain-containing protein [Armatimonadota bacterium]|nr:PEP-CTERM sorting domain-containing protein [Armatimonadota bacterium]